MQAVSRCFNGYFLPHADVVQIIPRINRLAFDPSERGHAQIIVVPCSNAPASGAMPLTKSDCVLVVVATGCNKLKLLACAGANRLTSLGSLEVKRTQLRVIFFHLYLQKKCCRAEALTRGIPRLKPIQPAKRYYGLEGGLQWCGSVKLLLRPIHCGPSLEKYLRENGWRECCGHDLAAIHRHVPR